MRLALIAPATRILRGLRSFIDLGLPQLSRADLAEPTRKMRPMTMPSKRPRHFTTATELSVAPRTAYDAHAAILLLKWDGGMPLSERGGRHGAFRPMTQSGGWLIRSSTPSWARRVAVSRPLFCPASFHSGASATPLITHSGSRKLEAFRRSARRPISIPALRKIEGGGLVAGGEEVAWSVQVVRAFSQADIGISGHLRGFPSLNAEAVRPSCLRRGRMGHHSGRLSLGSRQLPRQYPTARRAQAARLN